MKKNKTIEEILKAVITISLMVFSYYSAHFTKGMSLLPNQITIIIFFFSGVILFLVSEKSKFKLLLDQVIKYMVAIIGYSILYYLFDYKSELPKINDVVTSLILLLILTLLICILENHSKKYGIDTYIGFFMITTALSIILFVMGQGVYWYISIFILIFILFYYN